MRNARANISIHKFHSGVESVGGWLVGWWRTVARRTPLMMMRRILASDVLEDLLLDPPPFFRQFCEQSLFFPPPFFFSVTILRFLDIGFARINIKIEGREEGSVCTTVDVRSLKKKKKNKGNKYINESCFSLSLSFSVLNKFEYYRKQ